MKRKFNSQRTDLVHNMAAVTSRENGPLDGAVAFSRVFFLGVLVKFTRSDWPNYLSSVISHSKLSGWSRYVTEGLFKLLAWWAFPEQKENIEAEYRFK